MSENVYKIFTQPGCGPCIAVKAAMRKAGVPHEIVDITKDERAADILRSGGFTGTPVVETPEGEFIAHVQTILTLAKSAKA